MLVYPQETIDLKKGNKDLVISCLGFPQNETNSCWCGAEDGSVSSVKLHGAGRKNGITDSLEKSDGPITGLDIHPHVSSFIEY